MSASISLPGPTAHQSAAAPPSHKKNNMPSRRYHTKTRHGCNTCKARKVRCDEEKPICQNCTRGNRTCSYPNQLLTIPNALTPGNGETQEHVFPLRDLELLHQYTAVTYRIMCNEDPELLPIWQLYVPRLAFQHRFLLHGLLAVSALHRRNRDPEDTQKETLMQVARYHQQHALTLYIPLLRDINERNYEALFAFSLILGVICFAFLHQDNQGSHSMVSSFIDTCDCLVGSTAIATQAKDWLRASDFSVILRELETRDPDDFTDLKEDVKRALEALFRKAVSEEVANSSGEDAALRRNAYLKGIAALSTVLASKPGRRQISILISWPVMSENDFLTLIRRRDPLALVILAYYGVALHTYANGPWMLEGLGRRLTESVFDEVDASWHPLLIWPRNKVLEPVSQMPTPESMLLNF